MELDPAAITASVINSQIDSVKSSLSKNLGNWWKQNVSKFRSYLISSKNRFSKTKTILHRDSSVPLENLYVGTQLSNQLLEKVNEDLILQKLSENKKLLISATAGSGKSFFAKFLFLALIQRKQSIPILIEIRKLDLDRYELLDSIRLELEKDDFIVSAPQLKELLNTGRFTLILDGYDEVALKHEEKLRKGIVNLSDTLSKCGFVVTSRPDESLEFLHLFENYTILPMTLEQSVELIQKQNFDNTVKKKFMNALKRRLYDEHRDFASNPLLLTILLITYSEAAEVPSKMHVFYEQAFDALFFKHDTSKGLFRRDVRSGLQIDDFKRLLACVSASSYIRQKVSFSQNELIDYIRKGKKTAEINRNLNPEKFKEDLLKTVCILVTDGRNLTFNHRSFQEYFSALFLVLFSINNKQEIYKKYLARGSWDNALNLVFQINRELFEDEFVLPLAQEILAECDNCPHRLLSLQFKSIGLQWDSLENAGKMNYRPRYQVSSSTIYWHFQALIELLYKGKPGVSRGSFRYSLTKKNLQKVLSNHDETVSIELSDFSNETRKVLSDSGLLESSRIRLRFLQQLSDEIIKRQSQKGGASVESWL